MAGLIDDLRHAVRLHARTPFASLLAIVLLATAIATFASFLSLYADLALKPNPAFERGNQLISMRQTSGQTSGGLPLGLIERIAEESSSLESISAVFDLFTSMRTGENGDSISARFVTREFFSGLKPIMALGRGFDPADHAEGAEPVAVITWQYWQDNYGGRDDALGSALPLTGRPSYMGLPGNANEEAPEDETTEFRIIGVLSEIPLRVGFSSAPVYLPLERTAPLFIGELPLVRDRISGGAFGRLARGAGVDAVVGELTSRYADPEEGPALRPGMTLEAIEGIVLLPAVQRDLLRQLSLFLAGSILLAIVAASNISLFLLSRAPGRQRELAIRMAVGAPLKRLMRQLGSEAVAVVLLAVSLGVLISIWTSSLFSNLSFLEQAQWNNVTVLNWRVLSLVGLFAALLSVAIALTPILGVRRRGIARSSRQIAARATPLQHMVCTIQITIAGAVGAAALAFAWVLASLMFGYPGYQIENRFAAQLSIPDGQQNLTDSNVLLDAERWRDAIGSIPGVDGVSFSNLVPGTSTMRALFGFPNPENPERILQAQALFADEHYLDVLGLELVAGRFPDGGEPGLVVNQALARDYFGHEDVIGERLPVFSAGSADSQVVGIMRDLSFDHPNDEVPPYMFMSLDRAFAGNRLAVIASGLALNDLRQGLADLIDSGELELELVDIHTLREVRHELIADDRVRTILTMAMAVVVVFLAALGFYGTQRFLVAAGRREYAIRASLGAGPRALGRVVIRRGILLGLPGLVLGTAVAFIVVAWMRDDFVPREVSPGVTSFFVIAGLAALVIAASLGPARQARRTEPAPLLRED